MMVTQNGHLGTESDLRPVDGEGSTTTFRRTVMVTGTIELELMSGFELRVDGVPVDLPQDAQRVLAYLALRGRPQTRLTVASMLWIDLTDARATANLRTALWRLGGLRERLIRSHGHSIALSGEIEIDLVTMVRSTRKLIAPRPEHDVTLDDAPDIHLEDLAGDLLPEWDEDWILFERERLHQMRIHAIEELSRRFCALGRLAEAIDAGLTAVAADPLRATAHRALIEAHLAEGNVAEARRQFDQYRRLLWDSLALEPSSDLCHLVGVLTPIDA